MTNKRKEQVLNDEITAMKLLRELSPFQNDNMRKKNSLGVTLKNNPNIDDIEELEDTVNSILEPLNKTCFVPPVSKQYPDQDTVFIGNFVVDMEDIHNVISLTNTVTSDEAYFKGLTPASVGINL